MFGYTIVSEKFVQQAFTTREDLSRILGTLSVILVSMGAKYQYNEPGSGDVTYEFNNKIFEFNESPFCFKGFFIDDEEVSFAKFIYTLLPTMRKK